MTNTVLYDYNGESVDTLDLSIILNVGVSTMYLYITRYGMPEAANRVKLITTRRR